MTGIPDLGIRVDIMGRVLDPLLCVFLADIQSVGIGACMHVCVLNATCMDTRTQFAGMYRTMANMPHLMLSTVLIQHFLQINLEY